MATRQELVAEAYKRGLLPPDKAAMYEEMQRRAAPKAEHQTDGTMLGMAQDYLRRLGTEAVSQGAGAVRGQAAIKQGLMDIPHGGAQLAAESLPDDVVGRINELNRWLISKGLPMAEIPGGGVTQQVKGAEEEYQKYRKGMGGKGFDVGRLAGNVALGAAIPATAAKTLPTQLMQATGLGAAFGGLQPVTQGDYW